MRYAIYFMPGDVSCLWRFGCQVLGYDAARGCDVPFIKAETLPRGVLERFTETPRQYGFHATLKAPFSLADGTVEAHLLDKVEIFAKQRRPCTLPRLVVSRIGSFLALVPDGGSADLNDFAAGCVREFDALRAPLTEADLQRRLAAGLTERQTAYLKRWGYPYVFEEFRFHMTLTGKLSADELDLLEPVLAERFAAVPLLPQIDAIAVAVQVDRNSRFTILARIPLGSGCAG